MTGRLDYRLIVTLNRIDPPAVLPDAVASMVRDASMMRLSGEMGPAWLGREEYATYCLIAFLRWAA